MRRSSRRRARRASPLVSALLVVLFLLVCLFAYSGREEAPAPSAPDADAQLEVRFLDIGQGDAALLTCGGQTLLIDGGKVKENQYLVARLKSLGVERLDAVICSHPDEDHCGGLAAVFAAFPAEAFYCSVDAWHTEVFSDVLSYAGAQECSPIVPKPGSFFPLGAANVEFLGPVADYGDDPNEGSLVVRVSLGEISFLFTGDMGFEAEDDLLAAGTDVSATVLKVGHHGSAGSSSQEFLAAVGAEYGVISVGVGNDYGHPTEAALNRLAAQGMRVYRTDQLGEIVCRTDGVALDFSSEADVREQTWTKLRTSSSFIGNSSSKVVHTADCARLPGEENRAYFDTLSDARAAGYRPHKACTGAQE